MGKSNTWFSRDDAKETSTIERRIAVRYSCDADVSCQPGSVLPTGNDWPAKAMNISVGGIGLILNRYLQPGAILKMELQGPSSVPFSYLARVIYATAQQDGQWLIGCAFIRQMSEDELRSLLGETGA